MKQVISLIFVIILLIVSSCSDDSTSPNNVTNWPEGTITISEALPDWTYGAGYSLILCVVPSAKYTKTVIDSCAIGIDGSFTIHLPPLEDRFYDRTLSYSSVNCFDSVVISQTGLKDANTVFEIHYGGAIKGAVKGKKRKIGNDSTNTYTMYYHAYGSGSNMSGSSICYVPNGQNVDTVYYKYSMSVNKHWNPDVYIVTSKTPGRRDYSVSNTHTVSAPWEYYLNK